MHEGPQWPFFSLYFDNDPNLITTNFYNLRHYDNLMANDVFSLLFTINFLNRTHVDDKESFHDVDNEVQSLTS